MIRIKKIQKKLKIKNSELIKFSMDFILSNQFISTVFIGCSSLHQLKQMLLYHSDTTYLSKRIYKQALNYSKKISKQYKVTDQLQ